MIKHVLNIERNQVNIGIDSTKKNYSYFKKNYYLIRVLLSIVQSSKRLFCEYKMKFIIRTLLITFSLFSFILVELQEN